MSNTARSSLIRSLKEEFNLENFFLTYQYPVHFCTASFKRPKHFYLIWNIFWSIYHVAGVLTIFFIQSDLDNVTKILAYATIWGYLSLSLTVLTDLVIVICFQYIARFNNRVNSHSLHWSMKILWFLSNISYSNGVLITCGYWILLYSRSNGRYMYLNVMEHALNSIYILLNIFITAKPFRIYHVWQDIIAFLIYIIFSLIYFFSGGTTTKNTRVIYFFTDWNHPSVAIPFILLLLFVGLPLVHTILFFLYKLRLYIIHRMNTQDENNDPKSKLSD
ncbi:protein rolling stone [Octopus bimaculoides]|uniref:Protein rolling stone n=1 Tax=Octopus bimaculoides TaxID=37653 RepID=A0A0L8IDY8_OCTBM|nr:protein rolling stone [Octopus bimaculoides]|eukprot:XP_014773737.1 PREDICTED: protein rolling stone-like [Octopus bimaculoides]